jgi:hypothetical protein
VRVNYWTPFTLTLVGLKGILLTKQATIDLFRLSLIASYQVQVSLRIGEAGIRASAQDVLTESIAYADRVIAGLTPENLEGITK